MTSPSGSPSGGERRPPSAASRFRLRFEKFASFVEEYGSHISLGGIFLKTGDPKPVGSEVAFEVELTDGYRLLEGTGEVVWIRRQPRGPDTPAGMALRFQTLDQQGRELVLKMLEEQVKAGGEPFEPDQVPDDAETEPGAAGPAQTALEFDAPWGDRLPEMPVEMLEEDAEDVEDVEEDDEPTITRPSSTAAATAAAEQAVRELEETPDFELASEPDPALGELDGPGGKMPDFNTGDGDPGDLFDVGAVGELPPEPSFELEEEAEEPEASFASLASSVSEPRPMAGFDLEEEAADLDDDLDDDEPTLIRRGGSQPPWQAPEEGAEDDEDPTMVSQRPQDEPAGQLTDIREARFPESNSPPAAGFSPLPGGEGAGTAPIEPPPPAASLPSEPMAAPPADEADPFVDLDPPGPEFQSPAATFQPPTPSSPPTEATGPIVDYEHELDDSGVGRQRKSVPKGVWAALLLVGIAAAGYLLRDELLELVGLDGSSGAPPIVASSAPEPPAADPRPAEPEGREAEDELGGAAEAGRRASTEEPATTEPVREPTARPETEPSPPPPTPTEPRRRRSSPTPASSLRPAGPPATRMEDVSWRSTGEGTLVTLRFDGEIAPDRVSHDPLGWAEDREQVVVGEIPSPYRLGAVDVRSPELSRIRTGVHPSSGGGSELRLVFDLGSQGAEIATVRCVDDRVEILIRGR